MTTIDWAARALESEIAYSVALGGEVQEHPGFIYIHNPHVPYNGDYNRGLNLKVIDFESFESLMGQIDDIHRARGIELSMHYEIAPPVLPADRWGPYLADRGLDLRTDWYMYAPTEDWSDGGGLRLHTPQWDEFAPWYRKMWERAPWYDPECFKYTFARQREFIKVFRPHWLMRDDEQIGQVYAADMGGYWRLFEVGIREELRGQGYGSIMLRLLKARAARAGIPHILISVYAMDRLRGYYERLGFRECACHSSVWVTERLPNG